MNYEIMECMTAGGGPCQFLNLGTVRYDHSQGVPKTICISGKLQNGKDTVRQMISFIKQYEGSLIETEPNKMNAESWDAFKFFDTHNYTTAHGDMSCNMSGPYAHDSYAKPVKEIASLLVFGRIDPIVFTEGIKQTFIPEWNMTWRQLMIWIGTKVFRTQDADTWVRALQCRSTIKEESTIITDLRFTNEADYFSDSHGGLLIRVERRQKPWDRFGEYGDDVHENESEIGLDHYQKFHEIVLNHTNLYDLYSKVHRIYKAYEL